MLKELYDFSITLNELEYSPLKNNMNENGSCYKLKDLLYPFIDKIYPNDITVPTSIEDDCKVLERLASNKDESEIETKFNSIKNRLSKEFRKLSGVPIL